MNISAKTISLLLASSLFFSSLYAEKIPNRLIDYNKHRDIVLQKNTVREKLRLTEKAFLEAMKSGEYVLLDARSLRNYNRRHIKGAISLPFTEFTEESLKKVIPNKKSKVLIYCNNNFLGSPVSFASKSAPASLNISTQVNLAIYGYHNVYELGPLLDVKKTIIPFKGTEIQKK
jgi:hypothetical protein